jgi:hypothetical protein
VGWRSDECPSVRSRCENTEDDSDHVAVNRRSITSSCPCVIIAQQSVRAGSGPTTHRSPPPLAACAPPLDRFDWFKVG